MQLPIYKKKRWNLLNKFHLHVPLNAFYILKKGLGLPEINPGVVVFFPNFRPGSYVSKNQYD
jgi:hypothetical protein